MRFPKYLSIQTTSLCNGRCVFCPYEQIKGLFPAMTMEEPLFRKIIDECGLHPEIERIILYLNNEPLTDRYLIERINYAKGKVPWASLHLLTNGSLLVPELADRLIDSGLDWIGFSLHGVRKETIENAMGLDYDLTFGRVTDFIERAKAKRNIKDFIMVTFLRHKYLTVQEQEEAMTFWKGKGIERISYFDGPISRAGNVKGMAGVRHKGVRGCTSIWANEMIHIVENGDVVLCCMDWKREVILGNLVKKDIYDIWNSKAYSALRDKRDGISVSDDDFICKRCEAAIPAEKEASPPLPDKGVREDLLLVTLPPWGVENPPIGLGFLDSYIKSRGLGSRVMDFNIYFHNTVDEAYKMLWHVENKNYWSNEKNFPLILELFKKQIDYAVERILSCGSELIGFSVVDPKERITIEVIKRIKKRSPQKKIILGGPACSTEEQRDFFIHNMPDYVDYFVVGEGEETLFEIIRESKDNIKSFDLPGVAVRKDGKWSYKPRSPMNLRDNGVFPAYEGFDLSQYRSGESLLVQWSRGCIGRCAFCKNHRLENGYRFRAPEQILKELEFLANRYGIKEITVCDNIMNGDIAQLHGVCDGINRSGLDIKWSGQIAPRKEMDCGLFSKMLRAGCERIQIGVESGSDAILKNMGKIYVSETAQENIRAAKISGMKTEIFIIIGYPGETEKEFAKTRDFIRRNAKYIDVIKSINTLHLIAGTDVYENYTRYNLMPLPQENWHYLWQTHDGNNYETRKKRAQRLLDDARSLGLRVMETNIKEGKEQASAELQSGPPHERLKMLKAQINQLQSLPQGGPVIPRRRRGPLKFIILFFIFFYTLFYIAYFWLFRKLRGKAILGGG